MSQAILQCLHPVTDASLPCQPSSPFIYLTSPALLPQHVDSPDRSPTFLCSLLPTFALHISPPNTTLGKGGSQDVISVRCYALHGSSGIKPRLAHLYSLLSLLVHHPFIPLQQIRRHMTRMRHKGQIIHLPHHLSPLILLCLAHSSLSQTSTHVEEQKKALQRSMYNATFRQLFHKVYYFSPSTMGSVRKGVLLIQLCVSFVDFAVTLLRFCESDGTLMERGDAGEGRVQGGFAVLRGTVLASLTPPHCHDLAVGVMVPLTSKVMPHVYYIALTRLRSPTHSRVSPTSQMPRRTAATKYRAPDRQGKFNKY